MASLPNPLACVSIDLFGDQLNQDQICSLRCCVCLQLPARPLYCITCKCPIGAACYDALQANDNTIDECPTCRTIDDYATATVPPGCLTLCHWIASSTVETPSRSSTRTSRRTTRQTAREPIKGCSVRLKYNEIGLHRKTVSDQYTLLNVVHPDQCMLQCDWRQVTCIYCHQSHPLPEQEEHCCTQTLLDLCCRKELTAENSAWKAAQANKLFLDTFAREQILEQKLAEANLKLKSYRKARAARKAVSHWPATAML